jgi:hypothetical protein
MSAATYGGLTMADVTQIIEGIEECIIGPFSGTKAGIRQDRKIRAIWQPYINKLTALRSAMARRTKRAIRHRA